MNKREEKYKTDSIEAIAAEKSLKCGLIMPISAIDGYSENHWVEVKSIIAEALAGSNFQVDLVSNANEIGVIQGRIVKNIYHSDIVVCDVSAKNPNVMFELGMRLAFDKPTVIIKDDATNYSFDTAPIEHITYPRSLNYVQIVKFKETLRKKVEATFEASKAPEYTTFLKHFGEFVVADIPQKQVSSDEYIISSIKELKDAVFKLGNQNPARSTTRSLTKANEMINWIESYIRDYATLSGGDSDYLKIGRNSIIDDISQKVMSRYVLNRNDAYELVARLYDSYLENVDIPL